jgi:hypothetical protein
MAIFRGHKLESISLSVSVTAWDGIKPAYIFQLPYPSAVQAPALLDNGVSTRKTRASPTIVSVISETQRGNRANRAANLGKAPSDAMGIGFDWFEKIHVQPQRLDLGNVVSDLTKFLELYNAYRVDNRIWTAFTNNAGDGIEISNLPTLPKDIIKQTSFNVAVQISPSGPPTINGTLDFTFDVTAVTVPITGTRIILFGLAPTGSVKEKLSWLTDIMKAADGTEQRLSVRRFPRQEIEFEALTARDIDRNELNAFLFDWHSRVFGVPLWWDARIVNQNVAINDTTISVANTSWADFRVGGLAVIIAFDADGNRTADTLEITAVNTSPSTIEFSSGVGSAYTAGQALLVPVVPGVLNTTISKARVPTTAQTTKVSFLSLDNDSTRLTPDAAAFTKFNDKAVIDDANCINKVLNESFRKKVTRIDGDTGEIIQDSSEDRSTPTTNKRWNAETAQRLWEIKSLLYALRGQQVSFFMPTFNKDLTLTAAVGIGSTSIDVTNIGYTQFMKTREPFTTIAIRLKDGVLPDAGSPEPVLTGSPPTWVPGQNFLFFDITTSTEISTTEERLFLAQTSPLQFDPADVERVEFIVKSRFDSDAIELIHNWTDSLGEEIDSQVNVSVSGVYDT